MAKRSQTKQKLVPIVDSYSLKYTRVKKFGKAFNSDVQSLDKWLNRNLIWLFPALVIVVVIIARSTE